MEFTTESISYNNNNNNSNDNSDNNDSNNLIKSRNGISNSVFNSINKLDYNVTINNKNKIQNSCTLPVTLQCVYGELNNSSQEIDPSLLLFPEVQVVCASSGCVYGGQIHRRCLQNWNQYLDCCCRHLLYGSINSSALVHSPNEVDSRLEALFRLFECPHCKQYTLCRSMNNTAAYENMENQNPYSSVLTTIQYLNRCHRQQEQHCLNQQTQLQSQQQTVDNDDYDLQHHNQRFQMIQDRMQLQFQPSVTESQQQQQHHHTQQQSDGSLQSLEDLINKDKDMNEQFTLSSPIMRYQTPFNLFTSTPKSNNSGFCITTTTTTNYNNYNNNNHVTLQSDDLSKINWSTNGRSFSYVDQVTDKWNETLLRRFSLDRDNSVFPSSSYTLATIYSNTAAVNPINVRNYNHSLSSGFHSGSYSSNESSRRLSVMTSDTNLDSYNIGTDISQLYENVSLNGMLMTSNNNTPVTIGNNSMIQQLQQKRLSFINETNHMTDFLGNPVQLYHPHCPQLMSDNNFMMNVMKPPVHGLNSFAINCNTSANTITSTNTTADLTPTTTTINNTNYGSSVTSSFVTTTSTTVTTTTGSSSNVNSSVTRRCNSATNITTNQTVTVPTSANNSTTAGCLGSTSGKRQSFNTNNKSAVVQQNKKIVTNAKGNIFLQRCSFNAFKQLPLTKQNAYFIQMDDDSCTGNEDTRVFLLAQLTNHRVTEVHCLACQTVLKIYDHFPVIDGLFFISPLCHRANEGSQFGAGLYVNWHTNAIQNQQGKYLLNTTHQSHHHHHQQQQQQQHQNDNLNSNTIDKLDPTPEQQIVTRMSEKLLSPNQLISPPPGCLGPRQQLSMDHHHHHHHGGGGGGGIGVYKHSCPRQTRYLHALCIDCIRADDVIHQQNSKSVVKQITCQVCGKPWSGASLLVGGLYTYDVFAANPCCSARLTCGNCRSRLDDFPSSDNSTYKLSPNCQNKEQKSQTDLKIKTLPLNYFSQYSNLISCPYCSTSDYHFVKRFEEFFTLK